MSDTPLDVHSEFGQITADARRLLELESSYGLAGVPFDPQRVKHLKQEHADARTAAARVPRNTASPAEKQAALDALCEELRPCCKCGLGEQRKNLVFGAGNPDADLMFIGEAPGQVEDEKGIPFVGPAGQLLAKIIGAMGLSRDQVYIANILKCRPPNNRDPMAEEIDSCIPNLYRQIEIIDPRIIVTLGNPATKTILQTTAGISRMRGNFVEWDGIEVMPTFHPSYLLRTASAKGQVWQDMKKIHQRMKELGLSIGELATKKK
jgi:DNA polymerase